jgi:DNA-binding LytR/AlgR family response regulator
MSDERAGRGVPLRIMLVDDDVILAAGLKDAFEHYGYVVLVVPRGHKAVKAAVHFCPDIVLLDVMMPEMDGWETLSRLRADSATESVPVIMLTAAETAAAKVRGLSLGADDYVTKPFGFEELRLRVEAVLRRTTAFLAHEEAETTIPVVAGSLGFELVPVPDIYYIEGFHNYTNVHTFDSRKLCRLTLREIDERGLPGFMRVQRSFIVNLHHVRGCGWATRSSYRLKLGDLSGTTVAVSRALIPEVQRRLGMRD